MARWIKIKSRITIKNVRSRAKPVNGYKDPNVADYMDGTEPCVNRNQRCVVQLVVGHWWQLSGSVVETFVVGF